MLDAADLVPVPHGLDPVAAEPLLVNGVTAWRRRATLFNLWAGRRRADRFRRTLRADLAQVLALARDGRLSARVAGRFALPDAAAALRFAERRGIVGKVVITAA